MSSIPKDVSNRLATQPVTAVPAANADYLVEARQTPTVTDTASGWDSYEVWRRFIKDARARRLADPK